MAQAHTNAGRHTDRQDGRTPAQWYATLAGLALTLAGLAGFIVDATFDTGDGIQGDSLLGFEVNGWHNVIHLASGLFLLAMAKKRATAKTAALAFGLVYGLVTIIGLIDGTDVLGLIPVNGADNVLHIALSALGIISALMSDAKDRDHGSSSGTTGGTTGTGTSSGRFDRTGTGTGVTSDQPARTTQR